MSNMAYYIFFSLDLTKGWYLEGWQIRRLGQNNLFSSISLKVDIYTQNIFEFSNNNNLLNSEGKFNMFCTGK